MTNDLVAVASTWIPPQVKTADKWTKRALLAGAAVVGVLAFNWFAPQVDTALDYAQALMEKGIGIAELSIGLFIVGAIAVSLISDNGKLHKLVKMGYDSALNRAVRGLIAIDPLSPIDARIDEVTEKRENFESNFARLDGVLSNIREKEDKARIIVAKAEATAKAARAKNMPQAEKQAVNDYAAYKAAADKYSAMRTKFIPMGDGIKRMMEDCDITIAKLKTTRGILADQWSITQSLSGVVKAAGGIFGKNASDTWQKADMAEEYINTQYGEELGHFNHLEDSVGSMLESIDLENATYSDEIFNNVANGTKLLTNAVAATPAPQFAPTGQPVPVSNDSLRSFIG